MRIRTVKPEFWQSETLASVAPTSRLLAIALLNFADDEGLFWAVPQVIKGALFPFDEDSTNVRRGLDELSRIGFLALGTAEHGKRVGKVKNFKAHQKVDRPQPSKIAGFSVVWDPFDEDSTNVRRGLDEGSTMEWKGMEGKGNGKEGNSASQTNSVSPRAHEEPPALPPEPPATPAEPEAEPEGFSPELQALAARLRSSREVREFGFGGPPPKIQPPPPVEAPEAPAPVSAEERARLEALPGDKRPSREDFVRFAFAIAPKWREAASVFDTWAIRNWTIPPPIGSKQHAPQKIRNWRGALKNEIAGDGDPRHWMEMLPMGHLLKGDE